MTLFIFFSRPPPPCIWGPSSLLHLFSHKYATLHPIRPRGEGAFLHESILPSQLTNPLPPSVVVGGHVGVVVPGPAEVGTQELRRRVRAGDEDCGVWGDSQDALGIGSPRCVDQSMDTMVYALGGVVAATH